MRITRRREFIKNLIITSFIGLAFVAPASQAGDLKDRFRDWPQPTTEKERLDQHYIKTYEGTLGVLEAGTGLLVWAGIGTINANANDTIRFNAATGKNVSKLRAWAKEIKARPVNAWVGFGSIPFAIDGVGRLYLLSQNKDPGLTPLPGIVAHVFASKDGKKQVVVKRNPAEALSDKADYVFDKEGKLVDIKPKAQAAAPVAKSIEAQVSAQEESGH